MQSQISGDVRFGTSGHVDFGRPSGDPFAAGLRDFERFAADGFAVELDRKFALVGDEHWGASACGVRREGGSGRETNG